MLLDKPIVQNKSTTYRSVTSKDSGLFETCARHTSRYTARSLQSIYLCDACTRALVVGAFNDRAPVFHGETFKGFCGLCNRKRNVTQRQWFVCGVCWNVVLAYQKSMAASAAVREWWANEVQPNFPNLTLEETEQVVLAAYSRKGKTKFVEAATLSMLDFVVSDSSTNPPTPLFHIEQKTGPGAIDEMTIFQLDVNDYNDIVGAVQHTNIPSYIVHVQAVQEYNFPTRQTIVKGLWWTDIATLQSHQKKIAQRRGEDKFAISYDAKAFSPIASFGSEIAKSGYKKLMARAKKLTLIE